MNPDPSGEASQLTSDHLVIVWRKSARYSGATVGYVNQAKVCAVLPRRGDKWEGKVWFVIDNQVPAREFYSRENAEQWCAVTVRKWLGLLLGE